MPKYVIIERTYWIKDRVAVEVPNDWVLNTHNFLAISREADKLPQAVVTGAINEFLAVTEVSEVEGSQAVEIFKAHD